MTVHAPISIKTAVATLGTGARGYLAWLPAKKVCVSVKWWNYGGGDGVGSVCAVELFLFYKQCRIGFVARKILR
jgi:hypothetical protein